MSAQVQREYDAFLDSKRRFTLRGRSPFKHFHVKQFTDGRVLLEPRVLATPDQLSKKTLHMLDSSMQNFSKGIAGSPVDPHELREFAELDE